MHVVIEGSVFHLSPDGGVARIFREILPRMCRVDPELTLDVLAQTPLHQPLPEHPSIRYRSPLNVDRWLRPHRMWPGLTHRARRAAYTAAAGDDRCRLWHSTLYTLPMGWQGPTVVSVYDLVYERFPQLFPRHAGASARRKKAKALRGATRLICISESTRADVLEYYGLSPDLVVSIPLACSSVFRLLDEAASDSQRPAVPEPFLLWVGGRHAYKSFAGFVRAFATWDGRRDLVVLTVGSPLTRTEHQLIDSLGLEKRVLALSGVDDETLCRLYSRAAALVYPSLYEGFGLPLLEALTCGCPVVAARIPTSIEVAGECAALFEPGDAADMMRALEVALADGRGSNRVRCGLRRAAEFSWDTNAMDTLRVYNELTGRA